MHFASVCAAAIAVFTAASTSLASVVSFPSAVLPSLVQDPSITLAPELPYLEARAGPKRKKYKRPPPSHRRPPIKHPKGCTNTELIKNGDFDKNIRGWKADTGPGSSQFFWVKDSKARPAHSGNGQAYIFLTKSGAGLEFTTELPAVEYGNSITFSAWMRYDAPADLSSCRANWYVRESSVGFDVTLSPKWTKHTFEIPGAGRPQRLQFAIGCENLATPASVYMDDVSAKACTSKNPDPECQVLKNSDNRLVNPGFECPDGITAWQTVSNSGSTDSLAQVGPTRNNPTHSGKG
jgi:hypothetical protein